MDSYALRSMRRARARTIVCAAGIALSCALIIAILTTALSLDQALCQAAERTQGSWQVEFRDLDAKQVERVRSDPRTERVVLVREYGTAVLPQAGRYERGAHLGLASVPGAQEAAGLIALPEMDQGRLPEGPGEIALPAELAGERLSGDAQSEVTSDGRLALGGALSVPLGRRVTDEAAGGVRALGFSEQAPEGEDGAPVERLADVKRLDFTIVGFYRTSPNWMLGDAGSLALTGCGAIDEPVGTCVYATSTGFSSRAAVESYAGMFARHGAGAGVMHEELLSLRGLGAPGPLMTSIAAIAAVLAVVVVVASVSLVRTGFSVSVSERTRELGLLCSLGATPRQIRRVVRVEAALLAAAAVPAGVLVGLGATWALFRTVGADLASMLDDQGAGLAVAVSPWAIGIAALISLVVIAASALRPARSAARISAMEALRSTRDVRLSGAERRRAARRATRRGRRRTVASRSGSVADRMRLRLVGVAGVIAHRNLTRSGRAARIVAVSLAVSVALLISCGSLATYAGLGASITAETFDGDLVVSLTQTKEQPGDLDSRLACAERLNRALGAIDGVTPIGYGTQLSLVCRTPPGILRHIERQQGEEIFEAADGSACPAVDVMFLDDASWADYVRELGLPEADFVYPSHLRAIAFNLILAARDAENYTRLKPFERTGTVTLFTRFCHDDGWGFTRAVRAGADGEPCAVYESDSGGEQRLVPLGRAACATVDVEIAALAQTPPASRSSLLRSTTPTLLLPLGSLRVMAAASYPGGGDVADATYLGDPLLIGSGGASDFETQLSFLARDSGAAASAMRRIVSESFTGVPGRVVSIYDNADDAHRERIASTAIRVFASAFCAAVGLVAVANVFNTMSTSIAMRRREFAVLRSVGMSGRQFRRMIALECASCAVRGLAGGLAVGCAANYALYRALSLSVSGIELQLPAGWLAAAAATVVGALAISVAYGLGRSRAASVIDAVRGGVG